MRYYLCLIFFIFILACNPDKKKSVQTEEARFATSDASELFFKNVRQLSYDKTTMEAAKLEVYRSKERNTSDTIPVLNLAIVINWRFDEAYLLLEPNEVLQQQDTIRIKWEQPQSGEEGEYTYAGGNKEEQFLFASKIYRGIQQDQQFFILKNGDQEKKLLENREMREVFRKTVFDFYRLVDLL